MGDAKAEKQKLKAKLREENVSEVVDANRSRILATMSRTLRDQAEAEDVFQEVIENYVESYDLDEVIVSASAWLMKVAQNKVLDRFRRRKAQNAYSTEVRQEADDDASWMFASDQPDEEFERSWLKAEIIDALEALPPEQRNVFVMHELEGKSFEDIAELTGEPINTLLSRKRYATQSLREYLKEIYEELK